MSRIHDALKKAEEEKALLDSQGNLTETKPPGAPVLDRWGGARLGVNQSPAMDTSGRVGKGDPVLESVLERCQHRDWNTDPTLTRNVDARRHTLVSEEFRSLRSRLYLMRKVQTLQKLLITSPLPQEGKTFVAANLARVIAKQPDCRILLIDADLRIPAMHRALGAPPTPGLSEFLAGAVDITSIMQRGPSDNLFFVPAGKVVANPTELISNGRFESLMKRLTPAFDWIIVDSPPVIPVSDARMLAGFCDGVMLLVNSGTTPHDLARKACGEFPKSQLLGVILNRVEQHHTYGSYYYYGKGDHSKGNGKGA
ncbi:MAG: CpsD/CapB family tyrosine-protein kinase [Terriglobia bacterium]|jgi:capsular exopolysaccharide synthesis family protein